MAPRLLGRALDGDVRTRDNLLLSAPGWRRPVTVVIDPMTVNEVGSLAARTVSHEAIYRFIYALPMGELTARGAMLRSKRTRWRATKPGGQRGAPIVGMVSIEDRADLSQRRVPGHWEGDLIISYSSCCASR